jgi:hypothetical protein
MLHFCGVCLVIFLYSNFVCPLVPVWCWRASLVFVLCQVSKGRRWMPWHLEPKKDVAICDKPRGAGKRALIRGSPNGGTRPGFVPVTPV